jgi:hypothetical protein
LSRERRELERAASDREADEMVQWARNVSPKANELVLWINSSNERPELRARGRVHFELRTVR